VTYLGSTGAVAGDYNHDGKLDLAIPNTVASTVSIISGNGDGTLAAGDRLTVCANPLALALGRCQLRWEAGSVKV
jgi:FG-GAP repeat